MWEGGGGGEETHLIITAVQLALLHSLAEAYYKTMHIWVGGAGQLQCMLHCL